MDGIEVSVSRSRLSDDVYIIKVAGYVDTTTSVELENALDNLLKKEEYKIVVDLEAVDYISSAGWGIFISEIKGIRENGGDLKLADMTPDVLEVFELLEFRHILRAYSSVEEAIADFGNELTSSNLVGNDNADVSAGSGSALGDSAGGSSKGTKTYVKKTDKESLKNLSIEEKIKKIVVENPELGPWKIKKELNTPKYNNSKAGVLEVRRILQVLNLDSFGKRYRFSQSF